MKELMSALRPVRIRLRRNRLLRGLAAGLAAGLASAALLQAAACLVPVPDRGLWAAVTAGVVLALAAAVNVIRPVGNRTAAKAADACGLEERAITALENAEENGKIHLLQRRDTVDALRRLDVKKIRPGSVKKQLLAALGCAVLLGALLLVPSPRDREAAAQKTLRQTLQAGKEALNRAAEEDEKSLTGTQRRELRRITGELERELDRSRDAADALVAMDRAEKRLEQINSPRTAGDAQAAAAAGSDGEGREAGSAGEGETAAPPAQAPAGPQTGMSGTAETQKALNALRNAVSGSQQKTGGGQQNGRGQTGTQAVGSNGADSASGSSQAGAQSGSGEGNQAGSGAGTGSTNLEQGAGGQSGQGHAAGNRPPEYKEEQYETIYDPERIETAVRDLMTNQNRLDGDGSVQPETGPGRGSLGGDVPWGEVLREYADTEALSADRENLTVRERQWVRDYFTRLTQQQEEGTEQ